MHPDDTAPTRRQRADATPDREVARTQPTIPSPRPAATPSAADRLDPDADLVGQVLGGKYRIVRFLGKGGFGAVYEAKDEILGASVAVKLLTPEAMEQHDAKEQFLGEARLLTTLDHPNVVRWITFDRTANGLHYFVMEFLRGTELSRLLADEEALPPARAVPMLLQILSALRAAHYLPDGRSLLHLDLKPGNVFVTKSEPEQVKVIDFGISQHVGAAARSAAGIATAAHAATEDLGATIATVPSGSDTSWLISENGVQRARGGTLLFASPEHCKHLRGDPVIDELDGRADLYSFGVMAFQMLTGYLPFDCRTRDEAYQAHFTKPVPAMAKFGVEVPRALEQFVARCLAKKREDRFANVKEAYDALQRVANPPSRLPLYAAIGAAAAGAAVWLAWPEAARDEVTFPGAPATVFLGPRTPASAALQLAKLDRALLDLPVTLVMDPKTDAPGLPGWTATLTRDAERAAVTITAPRDLTTLVDAHPCLRFGDASQHQHSVPVHVVWLPENACSIGRSEVRGAEATTVDPAGASFAIEVRGASEHVGSVQLQVAGHTQNARTDGTAGAAGTQWFVVPLDAFEWSPHDADRPFDFEVVVTDRAGHAQRRSVPLRIDARPLEFLAAELDVRPDRPDFYLLGPGLAPRLKVRTNRPATITPVARDPRQKPLDVRFVADGDDFVVRFPESIGAHEGTLEITIDDSKTVHHQDAARGRRTKELRYRYSTDRVTVGVVALHDDRTRPTPGTTKDTLVTNRDAVTLELSRVDVSVTIDVECRRDGAPPWQKRVAVHAPAERDAVTVPVPQDGRHAVSVRAYRFAGPDVPLTTNPEFVHDFVIVRDTGAPSLAIAAAPQPIDDVVDAARPFCTIDVADDSAEPIAVEWRLAGPSPAAGTVQVAAGAGRPRALPWQELAIDASALADGKYTLSLGATDAAGNRAQPPAAATFEVARHGPRFRLLSPDASAPEWTATSGSTFLIKIDAADENGVADVTCVVRLADSAEPPVTLRLENSASDRTRGEWIAQFTPPSKWSQKSVEVSWSGRDERGRTSAAKSLKTTLQAFTVQRQPRVWFEIPAANVTTQAMRLVRGDQHYRFGGREQRDEDDVFVEFGLESARVSRSSTAGEVRVDDFYLDENEVPVRDFAAFVEHGYLTTEHWTTRDGQGLTAAPAAGRHAELRRLVASAADPTLPMTGIDWYEAAAYAHWAGKRLPTCIEWEYAVRGGPAYRPFSCAVAGQPVPQLNVGRRAATAWPVGRSADVTPAGRSEGIRDLCSNVMEWTASPAERPERMQAAGASFEDVAFHYRKMTPLEPKERRVTIGFRCAVGAQETDTSIERPGRTRVLTVEPPANRAR